MIACLPVTMQQQQQQQDQREQQQQDDDESARVLKQGLMEKRSDGLLQLWKRKHCTLTEEALLLHARTPHRGKPKELHFSRVKTVDCVERKGKHGYFTVVMADGKEIDFRCGADEGWSAEITLQMVQYKNRQAVLAVRSTRHKQQLLTAHRPKPAPAPAPAPGTGATEREQHEHIPQHSG